MFFYSLTIVSTFVDATGFTSCMPAISIRHLKCFIHCNQCDQCSSLPPVTLHSVPVPKQVGVSVITPLSISSGASTVTPALLPLCAVSFQRDEGIMRLSSCFQWREFEGDDQKQYIHQEFVYENVMYSVQRGLPWTAVAQIANLSKELLPEFRGESWLLNTCFIYVSLIKHIYILTIILLNSSWT